MGIWLLSIMMAWGCHNSHTKTWHRHFKSSQISSGSINQLFSKTMERMVNACMMWSLKSQGLLSESQCGFRKKKNHTIRKTILFALKRLLEMPLSKGTSSYHFLWSGEGLRYNVETWYLLRYLGRTFHRSLTTFHRRLPISPFLQCPSRSHSARAVWAGDVCSTRQYLIPCPFQHQN